MADVYQDIRIYSKKNKEYLIDDLFVCWKDRLGVQNFPPVESGKKSVVIPSQSPSAKKDQLQLEWFVFQGGVWGVHCKPAVYLYPKEKSLVNVRVYPKGELSYTDPPYDPESGWTVFANSLGTLSTINHKLLTNNYLYYESKIKDEEIKKPTKGWVVRTSGQAIRGSEEPSGSRRVRGDSEQENRSMEELFDEILPKLGLNQKEESDFKDYWLTKLPESPYYFVGVMDKTQRDYLEPLSVTPNPETSIRFSLYFEMLKEPKEVEQPEIFTPKRDGFTLVDWGGMIKLYPDTPFTCSQ